MSALCRICDVDTRLCVYISYLYMISHQPSPLHATPISTPSCLSPHLYGLVTAEQSSKALRVVTSGLIHP